MAVFLTSIKHYLTFFWQCSCIDLVFRKGHCRELATKSQKHVLVEISSTEISYNVYNIYNWNLRNDAWLIFGDREKEKKNRAEAKISATFLINILFIVFSVSIQPSCCKIGMEYFNIKIRLLIRELSQDKLSGESYQRVSA